MVIFNEPRTLVKLGYNRQDLGEVIKKSSEDFQRAASVSGNSIQYVTFGDGDRGSYLLIVSQQINKFRHPQFGHNVILTATSYSDVKNESVADCFTGQTRMDLGIDVPEIFNRMYHGLNGLFLDFQDDPDLAMSVLTKGNR